MRIPLLACVCVAFSAGTAGAQDLQYRIVALTQTPDSSLQIPGFEVRMSVKRPSVRMDMDMGDAVMTTLVNLQTRKMVIFDAETRRYEEKSFTPPSSEISNLDSLDRARLGRITTLQETGERRKLLGYEVRRVLLTMDLPMDIQSLHGRGNRGVIVQEAWVATDSALNAAYNLALSAMSALAADAAGTIIAKRLNGFPLRTTQVTAAIPGNSVADADQILKGRQGKMIELPTIMEVKDLRTDALDRALFQLPAGYVKR